MSPRLNPWEKRDPVPTAPEPQKPEDQETRVKEPAVEQSSAEDVKPTVILTERDAYIRELMKAQPKSLDALRAEVSSVEAPGLHRLSLPEYFEQHSYDCTRGDTCKVHKKDKNHQVLNHGAYMMRWLLKDKRALDRARNVYRWVLANRVLFPDAPKTMFSASGGVEVGDAILAVLNVEQALKIRVFPGKRSHEMLQARISPNPRNPKRVLMTGDRANENYYEPDMSAEESEGTSEPASGEIQVD